MNRPHIFVAIPAYRDRECQWTLRDMFERARHPERVFAGVCWQTVPGEDDDCFQIRPRPSQVRTADFHAREARGLGWARAKAQELWQGEEYTLQIDSHMRFADDWDERMLELLAKCKSPDPVLTHYPASYNPPDEREDLPRAHVQTIRRFLPNGLLEFGVAPVPEGMSVDRPMHTAAVAGGFIFGSSRILRDVPSDPELYFNGEEPNLAVRLWTAGFDLFSPHITVIYHYYRRVDSSRVWNDAASRQTRLLHERTLHRMRLLTEPGAFTPDEVAALGRYGLGTRRSLAEYEAFAGVSFGARSIALEARQYPFVRTAETRAALQLPDTLRPVSGTQLFILGDEGILFSESGGTLHRLNRDAARVWCALEAGWGWNRVAETAVAQRGIADTVAMAELRELATHWIAAGLLQDTAAKSPSGPRLDPTRFAFRSRDYRLLDTVVRLRFGDATVEGLVHAAFAHLEVDDTASTPAAMLTVVRILDWHYIFAGDQLLLVADTPSKLVPKLKAEVMARAIGQKDHVLHLHAAAVAVDGKLIVLPAPSGNGKTLLTARLLSLGGIYFSDEAVLLRRDGTVQPIPTALSVKSDASELLRAQYPKLQELPEHERDDGVIVRYMPPPPTSLPSPVRAERPALIVFPRYVPGAARKPARVAPADALRRMLDECLAIPRRLDFEAVATIVDTVDRVPCWEVATGDVDTAIEQIRELLEDRASRSERERVPPMRVTAGS